MNSYVEKNILTCGASRSQRSIVITYYLQDQIDSVFRFCEEFNERRSEFNLFESNLVCRLFRVRERNQPGNKIPG